MKLTPLLRQCFQAATTCGSSSGFQCQVEVSPHDHAPIHSGGAWTSPFLPLYVTFVSAVGTQSSGITAARPSKEGSTGLGLVCLPLWMPATADIPEERPAWRTCCIFARVLINWN